MKTTVGSTSSPNVVIGDPVASNALDRSLRLSPAKSMRDDGKKKCDKVELFKNTVSKSYGQEKNPVMSAGLKRTEGHNY